MMPRLSLLRTLAKSSLGLVPRKTAILPPCSHSMAMLYSTDPPEHHPPSNEPWIPEYIEKFNEPIDDKRNRLIYQSRKRGMLENGLLLGSFSKLYLKEFDDEKLAYYDRLINLPSNDWDIYAWAVGQKETPEDFDNVVMDMLKQHAKNENKECRTVMPELH